MQLPEPTKKDLRSFGMILGGGVIVIFGLFFPWVLDRPIPYWPFIFAAIVVPIGLIAPMALKPVYKVWMKIGLVLGWINTRIILGVFFYLIMFPIGFAMRLFGWDAMARKLDDSADSYRVISKRSSPEKLEKPY
ncbi:MAG: SxtJ family membrane protein [Gammaproteobacteria bacterium]